MTNIEKFKEVVTQMIPEIIFEETESSISISKYQRIALPKSFIEGSDPEKMGKFLGTELLKGQFIVKEEPNNRLVKYRELLIKFNRFYSDIEAEVLDALICLNCQNSVIPEGECCVTCGRTGRFSCP